MAGISIGLVLAFVARAEAASCECGEQPACALFRQADAVFAGTAVDVTEERLARRVHWKVTKFVVDRILKGRVDQRVTIVPGERPTWLREPLPPGDLSATPSDCHYAFAAGQRYLVYAYRTRDGDWAVSHCLGAKPLDEAEEDLAYAALPARERSTSRIHVRVEHEIVDSSHPAYLLKVPAAGVELTILGKHTELTAWTAADGIVEVPVRPGPYSVVPRPPATLRAYRAADVDVPRGGCAPAWVLVIARGSVIDGVVHRRDGTSIAGVTVDAIPQEAGDDDWVGTVRGPAAVTDESGRFRIDAVLPGRYRLVVNDRNGPTAQAPYRSRRTEAPTVDVDEGKDVHDVAITVGPLPLATVSGVVIVDGIGPFEGARVVARMQPDGQRVTDSTATDANGTFRLRVIAGARYLIRAEAATPSGRNGTERSFDVIQPVDDIRLVIRQPR